MKVYTEVVWTWDEEKGELVEESSKSHEYEGPIVEAIFFRYTPDLRNLWAETEAGWKEGWSGKGSKGKGDLERLLDAGAAASTGFYAGLTGMTSPYRTGSTSTSSSSGSTSTGLLKTQTAGTGSNFGRYGDISQQAPGGWIRQQNQNRDGRSSTLMTRGLSKKQINARNTA